MLVELLIVAFAVGAYLIGDVFTKQPEPTLQAKLFSQLKEKYPYMSDDEIAEMVKTTLRLK